MSRADLVKQFEGIFARLLTGEKSDPYEADLSFIFEVMGNTLLPQYGGAFDGVSEMRVRRRSPSKLEFVGEMWILGRRGRGGHDIGDTTQPFRATAVDKRVTKQGIWIQLWVGEDHAEAELSRALGVCEAEV
jgi:hypothetical protein